MGWNFQIIDNWDDAWSDAHMARWQRHMNEAASAHVFFHPALVRAWVDTYLPLRHIQPLFIWAQHNQGLCAMLPLTLWRKNWKNAFLTSVVPMGYSDFDYHDPIFSQEPTHDEVQSFWAELREALHHTCSYDELCVDGVHEAYMPDTASVLEQEPCPFINIHGMTGVEDYLGTRNKKMRYNLRRQQKKVEAQYTPSYTTYSADSLSDALAELPLMLDYHRLRWPKAYKAPRFHENLLRQGLAAGVLHFTRLNFGAEAASWRIGFYFRNRYYSYMPTLNPALLEYGAGKMHLLHCIHFAIQQGLDVYDQLRGAELYKSEWTEEDTTIYHIQWRGPSLCGGIKRLLLSMRNLLLK